MAHLLRLLIASLVGLVLDNWPSAGIAARTAGGGHELVTAGTENPGAMNASHVLGK